MELVPLMYNAQPYFSIKNLGKKNAHYTWNNMVNPISYHNIWSINSINFKNKTLKLLVENVSEYHSNFRRHKNNKL